MPRKASFNKRNEKNEARYKLLSTVKDKQPTEALNHNKPNGHKSGCQCKSCCVDE